MTTRGLGCSAAACLVLACTSPDATTSATGKFDEPGKVGQSRQVAAPRQVAHSGQVAEPEIAESAERQIEALIDIKKSKTPLQNKIDSRLYLGLLHQRNDPRLALLKDFRFVMPEADGRFAVSLVVKGTAGVMPVANKVTSLGGVVKSVSPRHRSVTARVRLDDLETFAAMPDVRRVRQVIPFMTHAFNVSEGDATHGADEARGFFGTDGSGVKVCVLSDGVDSLGELEASGDLPPTVDVLPGTAGSGDEGTAMLEIVHDLAPGAALGFATAGPSEADFAQNILDLADSGCNIIVDDIIYLDESPFQDGPVAQAVNAVNAAGVLYFSSAGNEGNLHDGTSGTWEGDFLANGTISSDAGSPPINPSSGPVHNFGGGSKSIRVQFGGGNPPLLIWAEHYDLDNGNASTDFDLYDMDGNLATVFDASTDGQDGSDGSFPIEFIGGGTFGGERLVVAKFAPGLTSSVPMFNLIVFRGILDQTRATPGATRGHSASALAFSVAATPAAGPFGPGEPSGPFPDLFTAANESETFTSDGPRRIILGPTGDEITPGNRTSTGGTLRQKPDITAADGVACAAPGFDPFYGTSAAAPHAAAIAALLKSRLPGLTQPQIRTALTTSAIDIEGAGVDRDTGAGIVMAHAALQSAGATPGALLVALAATTTQAAGDGDAFIETNEDWALTLPLENEGTVVAATAITATLSSSSPGITFPTATSPYPDLPIGASANNTVPFIFHVGPSATCGGTLHFTLTVSFTGGASPKAFNYDLTVGSPGTPATVSYTGPAVFIPDGSGGVGGAPADANLAVSGLGNIFDVNLRIDGTVCTGPTTVGIDHTFVSDLQISLISPAATSDLVINHVGGFGQNFCQTLLDDQSAGASIQTVVSSGAPFMGSFKPNAPLAAFNGQASDGTWTLRAQDFFAIDTGHIRAWSLIVTPAVCNAPPQPVVLAATKTVAGELKVGTDVTYTVTLTNTGLGLQTDNPGDELTDVLPASLTLLTATASSGAVLATLGTNTVTWDGQLAGGASVTITITAKINLGTQGSDITNTASFAYDADRNGTNEASGTADVTFMVAKIPTATALASSLNPSTFGAQVTFTATVTPAGPTGTVTFKDGTTVLGTQTLAAGVAKLTLTNLALGTHPITAEYSGDSGYVASTSPTLNQVVNKAGTITLLNSNLNPSTEGASITLKATVVPPDGTGTVTFNEGGTELGTGTLSGGVATLSLSTLSVGTHAITATYSGDANFTGSTSPVLNQVVNATPLTPTTTTLSSSSSSSTFGDTITLSVTVTPPTPTGTVTFEDGNTSLGTATLSGGTATFTTSALGGGLHSLSATYGGDSTFAASSSNTLTWTVLAANTTASLSSSANPVIVGQPLTLTATIASTAGTPTGTVTLKDGGVVVTTATLVNGAGTFTPTLTLGSHSLMVTYEGSANFGANLSTALIQVVSQATPPDAGVTPTPDAKPQPDGTPAVDAGPARPDAAPGQADAAPTIDAKPAAGSDAGITTTSSGCGCQTGAGSSATPLWLTLLVFGLLRRRSAKRGRGAPRLPPQN